MEVTRNEKRTATGTETPRMGVIGKMRKAGDGTAQTVTLTNPRVTETKSRNWRDQIEMVKSAGTGGGNEGGVMKARTGRWRSGCQVWTRPGPRVEASQ